MTLRSDRAAALRGLATTARASVGASSVDTARAKAASRNDDRRIHTERHSVEFKRSDALVRSDASSNANSPRRSRARRRIAVGLCAAIVASANTAASCPLKVGWEEWSPYIYAENGQFFGLEYEILRDVTSAANCAITMVEAPWRRALAMLEKGELDLLYSAGFSEDRARFANFSIPYRNEEVVLARRKTSMDDDTGSVSLEDWLTAEDASGLPRHLGVIRGNFYGDQIDAIVQRLDTGDNIRTFGDDDQMIRMLAGGRIDGYLAETGIFAAHRERGGEGFVASKIDEQSPTPLHYMFGKHIDGAIILRFNAAIEKRMLRSEGRETALTVKPGAVAQIE